MVVGEGNFMVFFMSASKRFSFWCRVLMGANAPFDESGGVI